MSDEFAAFVRDVQPGMHNLAMALTAGDTHEAEDLVQASLERVWSRWARLSIEIRVPTHGRLWPGSLRRNEGEFAGGASI